MKSPFSVGAAEEVWRWRVEVITIARFFDEDRIVFPERYRRLGFYLIRVFVAIVGGGLALAYGIDKALLAFNIGAATPLIIQTLSQTIPKSNPPR